jgi:hypothetical protein
MPFFLFQRIIRVMLSMGYPRAGWEIEWKKSDANEIAFMMKSCLYLETFKKMGCPELCAVILHSRLEVQNSSYISWRIEMRTTIIFYN